MQLKVCTKDILLLQCPLMFSKQEYTSVSPGKHFKNLKFAPENSDSIILE